MAAASLRRLIPFAIFTLVLLVYAPARAQVCANSCALGRGVCAMQARTARAACVESCAAGDGACRLDCMRAARAARAMCQATRADCLTGCSPTPVASAAPCPAGCSATAQTCFVDALKAEATCVQSCKASSSSDLRDCLQQCAAMLGGSRASCLAAFQGCLGACQGQVTGGCFDTVAMECTTTVCGPGQACEESTEFCSERCSGSPPSGTCLDLDTLQCTAQSCSATAPCAATGQICVPACPPPAPQGKCFDLAARACTDQTCDPTHRCVLPNQLCTLQCPARTPAPQCSSLPCGGACVISPPCPQGAPCPESPIQRGACAIDAAGTCACVPPSPQPTRTPPPTATPQCDAAMCSGPCTIGISLPCPAGKVCDGSEIPVVQGQCTIAADGSCACVPERPTPLATATPRATATPQCSSIPCGGSCVIGSTCPPGKVCPDTGFIVRPGECAPDSSGICQCVPASPPPMSTAPPTRTPQCDAAACGGACTIQLGVPCPDGKVCNGPELPALMGQCTTTASGGCDCLPVLPTPPATPTPQCSAEPCGGSCVIAPSCPPGEACPDSELFVRPGQCSADATGSCRCVAVAQPTLTPALCGADAAGTCGGSCPIGASCATTDGACHCVSGPGGPCGGNILAPPPVCESGLVCHQTNPDATGYCEKADCVPLFTAGCSDTSDCCEPCGNGTRAPCGVCVDGTCVGAP